MGDILSQAEIDALLNAMSSGDVEIETQTKEKSKTVRNYDFARPSKFSKDHLRTLENIFDNYARLIATYLTGYLRSTINVEVLSAEQVTYSEFSNSLSNPFIFTVVELLPLKGSAVFELSASIGYAIIDRVLGGPGEVLRKLRDFSEIEKILIERIVNQLLGFLVEPWDSIIQMTPKLSMMETNSQFASIMSPNEMVALVTLVVKVGDVEGFMHFCLPHYLLEPVVGRLNTKYWYSVGDNEDQDLFRDNVTYQLEKARVPVKAILGKTSITVNEFIMLQEGDVVTLDSYVNSDLDIMVGNLLKFHGKPGTSKNKNAIQITSIIRGDE